MEERNETRAQNLYLKDRRALSVDAVENIENFDGESITLNTRLGVLFVEGENLRVENLSREDGKIYIVGKITGMYYTGDSEKQNKGFFKRIFK